MTNRSSMPRLLRSRGGTTKNSDSLVKAFDKKAGSLTHKTMDKEPSLRALRAPKKDVEYALPQKGTPKRGNDSVASNAAKVRGREDSKRFNDPKEFGPNADESARAGDHFKKGGRASGGHWIQNAIQKPGALRRTLHAKPGRPIPEAKLEKAEHSRNPLTRKRARLAETLKGFKK